MSYITFTGIFGAPDEPKPKRSRRRAKHPNRVTLMAIPSNDWYYETHWQGRQPASPTQIPVEICVIHDAGGGGSAWKCEVDAVGLYDALSVDDPFEWLRDLKVTLFQKFTIEYDYQVWHNWYEGDYDSEFTYKVIWRGEPDRARLDLWLTRGRLLGVLEQRQQEGEITC